MPLSEGTKQRVTSLIESNDVMLFMKGNRMMPQCGFSARVVQMLDGLLPEYETIDVLADPDIREGIKEYSSWPTIPQLYIKGELIGGCDIVTDLYTTGELHNKLSLEVPEPTAPRVQFSDTAAERIREYAQRAPEGELQLTINARFESALNFSPRQGHEIEVQANGLTLLMDANTAQRADGLAIDLVETPNGLRFKIDNPNAPR